MTNLSPVRLHPLDGLVRPNIKITDLAVTALSYALGPKERWPDGDNHVIITQTTEVIVKVYTDVGIIGIGGASRYNGPRRMMDYAENVIKPHLLGKNPFDWSSSREA